MQYMLIEKDLYMQIIYEGTHAHAELRLQNWILLL